jgi:hypothetical protein
MIHVALHIDNRHVGRLGHSPHVRVAFVQHQVVSNANPMAHRRQNFSRVLGRLAVADLRGIRIQKMRVPAKLRHPGFKSVARARRFIEKQQERRLMRQQQRRLAAMIFLFQLRSRIEQQPKFIVGKILRLDVISALQIRHLNLVGSEENHAKALRRKTIKEPPFCALAPLRETILKPLLV